jgi:hypothetical protein
MLLLLCACMNANKQRMELSQSEQQELLVFALLRRLTKLIARCCSCLWLQERQQAAHGAESVRAAPSAGVCSASASVQTAYTVLNCVHMSELLTRLLLFFVLAGTSSAWS